MVQLEHSAEDDKDLEVLAEAMRRIGQVQADGSVIATFGAVYEATVVSDRESVCVCGRGDRERG